MIEGVTSFSFSVCKGKYNLSDNHRFLVCQSNKFCKYHCIYLFYREISKIQKAPPNLPEGGGDKFASILQKLSEKETRVLILLCVHRHSSPFGEVGWGFHIPSFTSLRSVTVGSEGSGEASPNVHTNHKITITKSQKGFSTYKKDSYI